MTAVRLTCSSLRYGRYGDIVDIPHAEASWLVTNGDAKWPEPEKPEPQPEPAPEVPEPEPEPVSVFSPPKPYAPKQEWVDYVIASNPDIDEAYVQRLTKADLISRYGSGA